VEPSPSTSKTPRHERCRPRSMSCMSSFPPLGQSTELGTCCPSGLQTSPDQASAFTCGTGLPFGEWAQNWESSVICYKYSLSLHKYICSFYSKDFSLYLLLVRKVLKCIFSWSLYLKNQSENLEGGHYLLTIRPSFAALIPLFIS